MAGQERKTRRRREAGEGEAKTTTGAAERGEKIKRDLDKVVDDIDDVLEKNAEEFVQNYVQRGGE
jgi:ubiquitin-like protein Pup